MNIPSTAAMAAPSAPAGSGAAERLSLSVIGTGYLGATHAVCMAMLGHRVEGHRRRRREDPLPRHRAAAVL